MFERATRDNEAKYCAHEVQSQERVCANTMSARIRFRRMAYASAKGKEIDMQGASVRGAVAAA